MIANFLPLIILALLTLPPWWMLWKRTGHSPWISLVMIIPLVNIVMMWVIAFKKWPLEERVVNVSDRFE